MPEFDLQAFVEECWTAQAATDLGRKEAILEGAYDVPTSPHIPPHLEGAYDERLMMAPTMPTAAFADQAARIAKLEALVAKLESATPAPREPIFALRNKASMWGVRSLLAIALVSCLPFVVQGATLQVTGAGAGGSPSPPMIQFSDASGTLAATLTGSSSAITSSTDVVTASGSSLDTTAAALASLNTTIYSMQATSITSSTASGISLTNLNSSLATLETTVASMQAVPVGAVLLWSGATSAVPSGWQLCDGTNSAPDLRDRFVIGAGSTYSVDATGGAASYSITGASLSTTTQGFSTSCPYYCPSLAVTSVSASSSTQTVGLPPYYALAYIIKT